jgi:hypothetical protein
VSVPYDYDQTNIEHLRAVVSEQEAAIEYLRECCKEKETENARLRDLMYDRAHVHAIQHMTEDELRVTAANALDENVKLRELATGLYRCWQGEGCEGCPMQDDDGWCVRDIQLRKLGVIE